MQINLHMKKFVLPLCVLIITPPISAVDLMPRTPKTFLADGGYVVAAPFRVDRKSFKWAAGALAVTATSSLLDRSVRNRFFPSFNSTASNDVRLFGDGVQVLGPAIGTGLFISGVAHDNDKSKETGYLIFECFVWSAVVAGGANYLTGRERPQTTDDPYSFQPFSDNASFPSGHTTQAFAAATVFAEQYPHWYVEVPAYSLASLTGFSRMYSSKHWLSDVVGGAMLGMFITHTIRYHRRRLDKKEDKTAWELTTDGEGLRLAYKF